MAKEIIHQKIVRNNIPTILEQKKITATTRILTDDLEVEWALGKKLIEETQEFITAQPEHQLEELADVLEVIHAILATKKIPFETLEQMRLDKKHRNGSFSHKIFLIKTVEQG